MPTNIDLHVTLSVIFLNSAIYNVTAGIGLKNPLSVGLWQKSRDLDPDPAENSNVNIWFVNNFQEKKAWLKYYLLMLQAFIICRLKRHCLLLLLQTITTLRFRR